MHEIQPPTTKGLRDFGLLTGTLVAGLFGLFLPWAFDHAHPVWPWVVSALLVLFALVAPRALRPVYWGWMRLGLVLGSVTTPVVLGIVFVVAIVPTAIVMRLLGHDPMARERKEDLRTYRVPSRDTNAKNMERPF